MYIFGDATNITNLSSGNTAFEPTAVQYHTNRINCIYRKNGILYIQYSDDRGLTWNNSSQIVSDLDTKEPCICRNYKDGWALVWSAYTDEGISGSDWEIKFCQALAKVSIIDKLISAGVEKGIDMAANGFRCSIAQEGFEYDFQNQDSIWEGLLIPGNQIEFFAGLGGNLDRRFKGKIDSIQYNDAQQQISISARGMPHKIIDRCLGVKKTYSTLYTYTQAISDLFELAGFRTTEYRVQATTLKLSEEVVFDRNETYSGAIKKLCDNIGWIIWEDEDGIILVGSPSNYPANVWHYYFDQNCFSFSRSIDSSGIPSRVVVSNEAGIEKYADVETHGWINIDPSIISYLTTDETDEDAIQEMADSVASDLSLKIFTIDIAVPLNFYIQVRDRINIYQTFFNPMVVNTGIIIKVSESIDSNGMHSRLTVAVIE